MNFEPMHPEPLVQAALMPLRRVDALYDEAARGMKTVGFLRWDGQNGFDATPEALAILGCPPGFKLTLPGLRGILRRSARAEMRALWRKAITNRLRRLESLLPCVAEDGSFFYVKTVAVCEYDEDGQLKESVTALQDVTQQHLLAAQLSDHENRLDEAQQMASIGFWEWNSRPGKAVLSPHAMRIFNVPHEGGVYSMEGLINLLPEDQRAAVVEIFSLATENRQPALRYDYFATDANGCRTEYHGRVRLFYGRRGPSRMLGTIQDVTELRDYRRQVHSLAFFDPVTALPNRAWLIERVEQALNKPNGLAEEFGMLMLGLDQFKKVNESLGHSAGDQLLRKVGERLSQALRESDTVARVGGDGFAVIVPEVRQADVLARVASKLLQVFVAPFSVEGADVFVTASVGAALYPGDGQTAEELLNHVESALSHAKARGNGSVEFYSPQLTEKASQRLTMESELRWGVERHELLLHYQPKIELGSCKLVGAEALMRWNQPQRGMISPLNFIPLAEETGLIVRMGAWALHESCRSVVAWNAGRAEPLKLAVNLSVRQFGEGTQLVETVLGALAATGCKPEWLELEITESLLLDGNDDVRKTLETLAGMGITIAIDDFGTGYSALGYLTRLPVQTLKIDRSFVNDLSSNQRSAELVKAIVLVGRSLNMSLVAEGVETQAQGDYLHSIGCQLAQGWLYGRPVDGAQFAASLN